MKSSYKFKSKKNIEKMTILAQPLEPLEGVLEAAAKR